MFMRANHRARAREWGAGGIALRFGITRDDENVSLQHANTPLTTIRGRFDPTHETTSDR